jgi:hypothetical protein
LCTLSLATVGIPAVWNQCLGFYSGLFVKDTAAEIIAAEGTTAEEVEVRDSTAEDVEARDSTAEDVEARDSTARYAIVRDAAARNAVSRLVTPGHNAARDSVTRHMTAEDATARHVVAGHAATRDAVARDVVYMDRPVTPYSDISSATSTIAISGIQGRLDHKWDPLTKDHFSPGSSVVPSRGSVMAAEDAPP